MALRNIEDRLMAVKALNLVLENQMTSLAPTDRVLALLPPSLDFAQFTGPLTCYSPYFNDIDTWSKRGVTCSYDVSGTYDAVIVFPTNSRDESLWLFAKAFEAVKSGGLVIATSPKDFGASRLEDTFSKLFESVETQPKYHCRVFWGMKGETEPEFLKTWLSLGTPRPIEGTSLLSLSGCFSANDIDEGSAFLIESLPKELSGPGADIGCGYGYLTHSLLKKFSSLSKIDLFEIDWRALECAKANIDSLRSRTAISYHWTDARVGLPSGAYDWIVMNPAFHERGFESAALGISMIKSAASALCPDGTLYFVANRKLPYEEELQRIFRDWKEIAKSNGFKVIAAKK